jgi:hypothetical protein
MYAPRSNANLTAWEFFNVFLRREAAGLVFRREHFGFQRRALIAQTLTNGEFYRANLNVIGLWPI